MARRIQVEIVGDSRSVERAFKRAGGAADNFGGKMRRAAKTAVTGAVVLGGAAVAATAKSISMAAEFEGTMSRIVGLAGASQKQTKAWADQIIALGPEVGKSPRELASALYFIVSSGVPAARAMSVLDASARAAAAGLGDTEKVADAVTSVMNAYASTGMSAARATDVLVATVREGKGEASEFAPVIGNVAAFASRLSVSFEEVGAALAAMTQLGTDPATAATQLQAFFSQILKPSPKAEKALDKVHLSFEGLAKTLSTEGLLPTLEQIRTAFAGNTRAMAQAFPNIRALRALLALTADDGGKVKGVFDRMRDSSGSLGTAFEAASTTSAFALARLRSSVEALMIVFGSGFLPVVTKVAQALSEKLADPAFVERVRMLGELVATKLYNAFLTVGTWFSEHWEGIKQGLSTAANLARGFARWVERIASVTPGGAGTLLGLLLGGILLTKIIAINRALLVMLRRLRLGGGSAVAGALGGGVTGGAGKPGKPGKLPPALGGNLPLAVVGAVLATAGGGTQRGDRSGQFPLTFAALQRAARGRLGPRKLGILKNTLGSYSFANAPDSLLALAERRLATPAPRYGKRPMGQGKFAPGRQFGGSVLPGMAYRVGERGPEMFAPASAGTILPGAGGAIVIHEAHFHGVQNVRQLADELGRFAKQGTSQTRGRYGGQKLAFG